MHLVGWRLMTWIIYHALSKITCDILAIPITTLASKFIFSVRIRVIDKYYAFFVAKIMLVKIYKGDCCIDNTIEWGKILK